MATISAAHIYNLRKRRRYRECRMNYTKTRSAQVAIGERRKPRPEGKPGYLRVDTAHQGDLDGRQVAGAVAAISQKHLEPVLRAILSQFPFPVRGFHSDIGSEFINDSASGLLKRLLIEQAKARSRKHMGFGHIAAEDAEDIGRFYRRYFNPYLNSIGRNGQPERMVDERGKAKYVCRRYATRWETLCALSRALPEGESCLKAELSDQALDLIAKTESDSESAGHMPEAKRKLFLGFREERKSA